MKSSAYRPEIDGLRAVAVLAVVLYHAGWAKCGGGYVGVDVFFVISGYLIGGNIVTSVRDGSFSLAHFYERRARRILPALTVVLLATALVGSLVLLPGELTVLGETLTSAALSTSNHHFWLHSGYFAPDAEANALLHTWSLAVEEQFYLLFPLPFAALVRRSRRVALGVVGCTAGASLVASVVLVHTSPVATFYLLPTRAWELLLGALLALDAVPLPRRSLVREALTLAGAALVLVPVATFTKDTTFPGANALWPCVGTAALIHGNTAGDTLVGRLLRRRAVVGVGLVSYSLYLWHWPVLVFAKTLAAQGLTAAETALALAASGLLSILSWRFVEQPLRRGAAMSGRRVAAHGVLAMGACALTGLTLWISEGLPSRVPPELRALARTPLRFDCPDYDAEVLKRAGPCRLARSRASDPPILLWGDSQAGALTPAVRQASETLGVAAVAAWAPQCAPLLGLERADQPDSRCAEKNAAVMRWIEQHPVSAVVLAARWGLWAEGTRYRHEPGRGVRVVNVQAPTMLVEHPPALFRAGLARTLERLHKTKTRVVIVGPVPEIGIPVPTALARGRWLHFDTEIRPTLGQFHERQRHVLHALQDAEQRHYALAVYPHRTLCAADLCAVEIAGRPAYCDTQHLSPEGALALTGPLARALSTALRRP